MTNNGKNKSFSMTMNLENFFRYRRMPLPKRSAEFIALIAVSCTLFLFLHTKTLTSRLQEMEEKLQPSELSSTGLSESGALHNELMKPEMKGVHKTYQYLKSTGQIGKQYTSEELNNTRKAETDILIFNRVPKVGSQTMINLLKQLATKNRFQFTRDPPSIKETVILSPSLQAELADEVSELEEPSVYTKHVAFVNFTQYKYKRPIYFNLVRDPVERIISWYYYVRAPWYFVELKMKFKDFPLPEPDWLKKDFETCLENGDEECTYKQNGIIDDNRDHRRQMLFFCGHNKAECMPFNSPEVLQKAKFTVESEYAVVGSWEDTNVTLTVLEHYIPKFFKHAKAVYYRNKKAKVNKNNFKPPVSEAAKNMLRKKLTNEIEFYHFCKQRLYRQYEALKLHTYIQF